MATQPLPSHAYVPGINDRHAENAFDEIRHTAIEGYDANQLAQCKAFQAGLLFFHHGYYWEAHEVLEPVWMALPADSTEKKFVQGLIQLANGRLKLKMGRHKAALRLVAKARALMPLDTTIAVMTLEVQEVHCWIDALESDTKLVL